MPDDHVSSAEKATNTAISTIPQSSGFRAPSFLIPDSYAAIEVIAKKLCDAKWVPKSYCVNGVPNQPMVEVGIMHGLEVGLRPLAALQSIAVINGNPSIWGDGMLALVRDSGLLEDISETYEGNGDEVTAVCIAYRKGQTTPIEGKFSVAMAKRAGLYGKAGPWTQYPARMLKMRARSWALRDGFADVLRGLRSAEEMVDGGDLVQQPDGSYAPPPRPTRADVAIKGTTSAGTITDVVLEESSEVEGSQQGAESENALFAFVDTDGVEHEVDASGYGNRFFSALKSAETKALADGLWETNSSQLARFRVEFENGAKFADMIEEAYGEALNRGKPAPAAKEEPETKAADPEQAPQQNGAESQKDTRPHAPHHFGKIPRKGDGTFDWVKFCQQFGNMIEKSETVDDLTNWQRINMNTLEQAATAAPEAYAQLQTRISTTRQWMNQ